MIDDNGWISTKGVQLSISENTLLVSDSPTTEIMEIDLFELMYKANFIYLTKWQFLKLKIRWMWKITRMSS